jgi:hypothetical protein
MIVSMIYTHQIIFKRIIQRAHVFHRYSLIYITNWKKYKYKFTYQSYNDIRRQNEALQKENSAYSFSEHRNICENSN